MNVCNVLLVFVFDRFCVTSPCTDAVCSLVKCKSLWPREAKSISRTILPFDSSIRQVRWWNLLMAYLLLFVFLALLLLLWCPCSEWVCRIELVTSSCVDAPSCFRGDVRPMCGVTRANRCSRVSFANSRKSVLRLQIKSRIETDPCEKF
jgi:hypothetical protein